MVDNDDYTEIGNFKVILWTAERYIACGQELFFNKFFEQVLIRYSTENDFWLFSLPYSL